MVADILEKSPAREGTSSVSAPMFKISNPDVIVGDAYKRSLDDNPDVNPRPESGHFNAPLFTPKSVMVAWLATAPRPIFARRTRSGLSHALGDAGGIISEQIKRLIASRPVWARIPWSVLDFLACPPHTGLRETEILGGQARAPAARPLFGAPFLDLEPQKHGEKAPRKSGNRKCDWTRVYESQYGGPTGGTAHALER